MSIYIYPPTVATVDTGALATAAKQDQQTAILTTIDADTGSIDTKLTTTNTNTGNTATSVASIDTKTPTVGQKLMAASSPVVIASDQSTLPISAASLPLPTGASTAANQATGNTSLSSIDGKLNSLGQKTMLASAPVVLASDQSAIPSSQSGVWNITNVSGTVSLPTGASTAANQSTANTSLANIETSITLDVVDHLDTPLLDTATTNITASSGAPVQVVAALASAIKKIQTVEDIGSFIGIYTGAAASEVLKAVLPLGGGELQMEIPAGTRISLRAMENTAISVGKIAINFLG